MPGKKRLQPLVWLAATVGSVVLGGGCGADDGETTPTSQRSGTATSTTADAITTTVAAQGPPEWVGVVRDINERDFALLHQPDPSRLGDVYAETCECWEERLQTVQFLADRNEHIEGPPPAVLFVRHEGEIADGEVHQLTVKVQPGTTRRVDVDGNTVQEVPGTEPSCISLGVRDDGPGGRWRVYSEILLPQCPEGG